MSPPRLIVVTALVLAGACATNPATGRRQLMIMSETEEIQLGRDSDREIRKEMGVYQDAALQRYVDGVGQRLARAAHRPGLPWTFTVVDSPAVNAFALPGGFIYLTRGILPYLRDEAELAAVLGHETGHVDARHGAAAYSKQTLLGGGLAIGGAIFKPVGALQGAAGFALGLAFLKNGRENEVEADRLGVGYSSSAGWTPEAMTGLLSTLSRLDEATGSSRGVPNWALTHPPAADRVTRVQEAIASARTSAANTTNRSAFEQHLGNLVFGDSREKGIVRGNEFLHPELRVALRFPEAWPIANRDEQVSARETEDGNVIMILEVGTGTSAPEDTARATMTRAGFRESSGQRTEINGLSAYVGLYDGVISNTRMTLRAAHIQAAGKTYVFAGLAPPTEFGRADSAFQASIRSFRELSRQEADRIQPNRLDFYVVRNGDTWASIARGPSGGNVKPATLAIMNGVVLETPPRPGDRIRIVAGG